MKKRHEYKEYESLGQIYTYVIDFYTIFRDDVKKRPSMRTVSRWLALTDSKSKYKKMHGIIRTKGKVASTVYNMEDVSKMLMIDKGISIDDVDAALDPEAQKKRDNELKQSFTDNYCEWYFQLNISKYKTDKSFRSQVDNTMNHIKTNIMLNLMMDNEFDPSLYELDNLTIQSSAMQHVNNDVAMGYFTAQQNDEKVNTGELKYYLKKKK